MKSRRPGKYLVPSGLTKVLFDPWKLREYRSKAREIIIENEDGTVFRISLIARALITRAQVTFRIVSQSFWRNNRLTLPCHGRSSRRGETSVHSPVNGLSRRCGCLLQSIIAV